MTNDKTGLLAEQNLKSLTVHGSIPCVVPQSHGVVSDAIPLISQRPARRE